MMLHQRIVSVLEAREWARSGGLYAILDACDTPAVPEKAKELGPGCAVSLYKGRAEEQLEAIAPYLVSVNADLFDWIVEQLWSEPWGIFVRSEGYLESLRKHFRTFLLVESPGGEEWYFRYYDPRILGQYLPTCSDGELQCFFGPVTMFGITDSESYGVRVFDSGHTFGVPAEAKARVTLRHPPVSGGQR